MLPLDVLINLESRVLDQYAKDRSGSELARFVAKRTVRYLLQEIEDAVARLHSAKECRQRISSFKEFI